MFACLSAFYHVLRECAVWVKLVSVCVRIRLYVWVHACVWPTCFVASWLCICEVYITGPVCQAESPTSTVTWYLITSHCMSVCLCSPSVCISGSCTCTCTCMCIRFCKSATSRLRQTDVCSFNQSDSSVSHSSSNLGSESNNEWRQEKSREVHRSGEGHEGLKVNRKGFW